MPTFSIVTTCHNRLDDLKKTIQRMASQADCELVVVDWNCPQKTAEYVKANFPDAKIVSESSGKEFNLCCARNIGAEASNGDILIFLDADILISAGFCTGIGKIFMPGHLGRFFIEDARWNGLVGSCVIEKKGWKEVLGYDEVLKGYGGNDRDFYFKLDLAGYKSLTLPVNLIDEVFEVSDEKKSENYTEKNKYKSKAVNTAYRQIKNLALKDTGKLEFDIGFRKMLWDLVSNGYSEAENRSENEYSIVIEISNDGSFATIPGHNLSRLIGVKVKFPGR